MRISEKIKAINNKIEQNKAQHHLDRQTAKISVLSSGNVSKYEFLIGKDVLPKKDLLEKAATIKRFEYLPLAKKLKKETSVAVSKSIKNSTIFLSLIKMKSKKQKAEKVAPSQI